MIHADMVEAAVEEEQRRQQWFEYQREATARKEKPDRLWFARQWDRTAPMRREWRRQSKHECHSLLPLALGSP